LHNVVSIAIALPARFPWRINGMPYIQVTRNLGRLEKIKASYNLSAMTWDSLWDLRSSSLPVTWNAFPFEGSRVSCGDFHSPKWDGKAKFKPL
jgi:hypothetical protein